MGQMAVKLAREAYFGEQIMLKCTVYGSTNLESLPIEKVLQLKCNILLLLPEYACNPHMFEPIWRKCVDAINHACCKLRKKSHYIPYMHISQ